MRASKRSLKGWMKRWLWLIVSNLFVVMSGCDQVVDEGNSQTESEIAGQVWMTTLLSPMSDSDEWERFSDEMGPMLIADGWQLTERGFEYRSLFNPAGAEQLMGVNFSFDVNGELYKINEDASLDHDMVLFDNNPQIRLFANGNNGTEEFSSPTVIYNTFQDNLGRTNVEIVWDRLADETSEHEHTSSATTAVKCLDYNGPYGDCKEYTSGWQEYYNFMYSDCYYAVLFYLGYYCWFDHTTYSYCNGSRNCSPLIGHSSSYHCH